MSEQQSNSKSHSAAIIALWSVFSRQHALIEVVSATTPKLVHDGPVTALIPKRHMAALMTVKVTFDKVPLDVEDSLYKALDELADDFAALPDESADVFGASRIRFDDRFALCAAFRKTGSLQWQATFPWTGSVLPDDPGEEASLTAAARNPSLVSTH